MYSASIILDSVGPSGQRLTTMRLSYPKFVHGEFLTHRMFSRNSSSSRAIPVQKVLDWVLNDPVLPVYWGKNQKGMQATEEFDSEHIGGLRSIWLRGRDMAISVAERLMQAGVHKQIANRVLEPYVFINTLVTSSTFDNFFELRCHKDAQPEIRLIADMMEDRLERSEPQKLEWGQWHLPFITAEDRSRAAVNDLIKISVARCARVSYLTVEGTEPTIEQDLGLYDRLITSKPIHASPAEHQASPDKIYDKNSDELFVTEYVNPSLHGNTEGWVQYRKLLELDSEIREHALAY